MPPKTSPKRSVNSVRRAEDVIERVYDNCLSDEALAQLKFYRYSGIDRSPIARYILTPYWNYVVTLLPMWLAPNSITLLGLVCILVNILTILILVPDFIGPGPTWMYWSFVLGLWLYSTLDNIDGKQARRTGSSSPLGELFDHGIDSLNCPLGGLVMAAACGYGSTPLGLFTALIPCAPMFLSSWEQYHTGTLYLGYINGPCEGIIMACGIMSLSAIYGPEFYRKRVIDVMDWHKTIKMSDLFVAMCMGALVFVHLSGCFYNVYQARKSRGQSFISTLPQLTSIMLFFAANFAWLASPYSHVLKNGGLIHVGLTMTFVFGRMTTKIILAHLTKQSYPYFTSLMAPLILLAIVINIPFLTQTPIISPSVEWLLLWGYLVFACVIYFRWAFVVIERICTFLDINCLTIKRKRLN